MYVPITLAGLTTPGEGALWVNGQRLDQSVHGNDFWQTEYDAATGTWDVTYNLDLDTPEDARQTAEFRFGRVD